MKKCYFKFVLILQFLLFFSVFGENRLFGQTNYPVSFVVFDSIVKVSTTYSFAFIVKFNVDLSWYMYAPTYDNETQGVVGTNIIFQLPKGITRNGKIQLPKTKFKGGFEIYEGSNIEYKQQFLIDNDLPPGEYIIKAKIFYQSCNDKICLPPRDVEKEMRIIVASQNSSHKKERISIIY